MPRIVAPTWPSFSVARCPTYLGVRGGRVISVVSQPHVWEQSLFYLTSIEAYGRAAYSAGPAEHLLAAH